MSSEKMLTPHSFQGMIAEVIPPWLQAVVDSVNSLGIFPDGRHANHVLLNEYKPGQGIMPHLDGDLFFPAITTVSLGSHTVLNFYEPMSEEDEESVDSSFDARKKFSVLVEPRSLLVLRGEMYHKYLHGIEEVAEDKADENLICPGGDRAEGSSLTRETRISLTIRHVPKTSKMKLKLGR